MDIGLREWLVIGGVILIGLIILDGWRRMNGNRNRLRMDIDPNVADLPDEPVRTHNPELPNGGARLVGEDPSFAESEQERESHGIQDQPEADPLFDSPGIEPDGRIEPALGDLIDQCDREEDICVDELDEAPQTRPTEPHAADNAEFDELLGPARVVSVTPEQPSTVEHYEPVSDPARMPESLEAVSAYTDGAAGHESAAEPMRFETDNQAEQDPEPLFPTLDGYDEPGVEHKLRANEHADESDISDLSLDEGILSKPRIVDIHSEPAEKEPLVFAQPASEPSIEPEEPDHKPEPSLNYLSDITPEPEMIAEQIHVSEEPVTPVQHEIAAVIRDPEPELDLDKPIPLLLDDNEPEEDAVKAPSLFVDDPILPDVEDTAAVVTAQPSSAVEPASRKKTLVTEEAAEPVPETKDLFAERPALEKTPSPESVLAITVMATENLPIPGGKLLSLVSACGMRYGDMNIFHRFEDGLDEGAVQFSMANAVKPGIFDLDNMDALETRGLTFFMSMEEPRDVMNAFECMLATAETVAKHMGAELLDENRSVLRPQTKEHYRQRIRDFGMRNLARRAH